MPGLEDVLEMDELYLTLARRDACALSGAAAGFRECAGAWIFLHCRRQLGAPCRRTFRRMVRQLRRMGLLRLYMLLHDRLHVYITLACFEKYKARHGQFSLVSSVSSFFSPTHAIPPMIHTSPDWMWRASRSYLSRVHRATENRRLFAFHQLCRREPAHAAARYPMVVEPEPGEGLGDLGGLHVVPQLMPAALWPPAVLQMLLNSVEPRAPALWPASMHTAAAALEARRLRRAWARVRRALRRRARV